MAKREYTICPIDEHKCRNRRCIEMQKKDQQDCRIASTALAKAVDQIVKINELFYVINDPQSPTQEELDSCVNIGPAVKNVAQRLGVSELGLAINIMQRVKTKKRDKS